MTLDDILKLTNAGFTKNEIMFFANAIPAQTQVNQIPAQTQVNPIPAQTQVNPIPEQTQVNPIPAQTNSEQTTSALLNIIQQMQRSNLNNMGSQPPQQMTAAQVTQDFLDPIPETPIMNQGLPIK